MDKRMRLKHWLAFLALLLLLAACGPLETRLALGTQVAAETVSQDGSGGGGDSGEIDTDALATSIQASLDALATDIPVPSATQTVPVRPSPTATVASSMDQAATPTATQQAAQFTALAQTLSAIETGTATPTETEVPPATETPEASSTPDPSASPTPVPCLAFRFVAHVTYAPGAVVNPSTTFYKSWQVQNTGTCTWNGEYALVYDSGFQLGGTSPLPLGSGVSVVPGQYVTLTIQLWSNPQPGTYSGTWMLMDDNGNKFGGGANQDIPLEVRIVVPGEVTPEFTSPASTAPPFYTSTPTP